MRVSKELSFDSSFSVDKYSGFYSEPSICPICKHAIKPQELGLREYSDDHNNWFLSVFYLCKHCYQTFLTLHKCHLHNDSGSPATYQAELLHIEPNRFSAERFDPPIVSLSPKFVKIYNQALSAESTGLDEIAGLGYRKAMEFLIKDFCIHLHPDDEDKIKSAHLSQCIKTYIKNEQILTLATRAAWIGNDEAHYLRKQEDRDVSDMKAFIKATVYFVGMVLIAEDAASMSPV